MRHAGRAVTAGAIEYLLDNTSDVRPVVLTARALMELAWNPKADLSTFIDRWSREEFGEKAAPAVAAICREANARRDFFLGHVVTQIAIHLHSNRMLLAAAEGNLAAALRETGGIQGRLPRRRIRQVEGLLQGRPVRQRGLHCRPSPLGPGATGPRPRSARRLQDHQGPSGRLAHQGELT